MKLFKIKVFFKDSYCIPPEIFQIKASSSREALDAVAKQLSDRGYDDTDYPLYPWEEMILMKEGA